VSEISELKIVQLLPLPNDATYQGALWGLRSDGVVCEFKSTEWGPIIPNRFADAENAEIKMHDKLVDALRDLIESCELSERQLSAQLLERHIESATITKSRALLVELEGGK